MTKKIILGVFTFLPLIFFGIYIIEFFSLFMELGYEISESDPNPQNVTGGFRSLLLWIVFMAICGIGITIYYLIHAINHTKEDSNQRLIWILILLLAGGIGSVVYYIVRIVPMKDSEKLDE